MVQITHIIKFKLRDHLIITVAYIKFDSKYLKKPQLLKFNLQLKVYAVSNLGDCIINISNLVKFQSNVYPCIKHRSVTRVIPKLFIVKNPQNCCALFEVTVVIFLGICHLGRIFKSRQDQPRRTEYGAQRTVWSWECYWLHLFQNW